VIAAAERARALSLTVWAMTGPAPNPLAELADDAICVDGSDSAIIQEVHLVAIHALCEALDAQISEVTGP
jgi:phosphoheptose isomerase